MGKSSTDASAAERLALQLLKRLFWKSNFWRNESGKRIIFRVRSKLLERFVKRVSSSQQVKIEENLDANRRVKI